MINSRQTQKYLFVLSSAFIVTCMCFYLMVLMIASELGPDLNLGEVSYITPTFAEEKEIDKLATRERAKKILPTEPPPNPDGLALDHGNQVALVAQRLVFGSIADLLGPTDIKLELDAPVSDLMPMMVVQPIYPLSAVMREVEGFVVVNFSVRTNGTVANPIVINSDPKVVFDEAALNAVSRFKFQPRVVDGDLVNVDNVQLRFAFTMDSLYDINEEYYQ